MGFRKIRRFYNPASGCLYSVRRQSDGQRTCTVYVTVKFNAEISSNSFIHEFLKWALPSLNLDISTDIHRVVSEKSQTVWQTV